MPSSGVGGVISETYNGMQFVIPQYINSMYGYNFQTGTFSTFNSGYGGDQLHRWTGGSVFNNQLYMTPNYDSRIMVVNLLNKSINSLSLFSTGYKSYMYTIVQNNKLYLQSPESTQMTSLNLTNNTLQTISLSRVGQLFYNKQRNEVVVSPGNNNHIYHINTITNTITFSTQYTKKATTSYLTGIQLDSNYILFLPFDETSQLLYDVNNRSIVTVVELGIPLKQRFCGYWVKDSGEIIIQTIPQTTQQSVYFLRLKTQSKPSSTSSVNKYFFKSPGKLHVVPTEYKFVFHNKTELKKTTTDQFDFYSSTETPEMVLPSRTLSKYLNIYVRNLDSEKRKLTFEVTLNFFESIVGDFMVERVEVDNRVISNDMVKISFDGEAYFDLPYTEPFSITSGDTRKIYVKIEFPEDTTIDENILNNTTLLVFHGKIVPK